MCPYCYDYPLTCYQYQECGGSRHNSFICVQEGEKNPLLQNRCNQLSKSIVKNYSPEFIIGHTPIFSSFKYFAHYYVIKTDSTTNQMTFYITSAAPISMIFISLDSSHCPHYKYVGFIAWKPPVSGKLGPNSRGEDVGAGDGL